MILSTCARDLSLPCVSILSPDLLSSLFTQSRLIDSKVETRTAKLKERNKIHWTRVTTFVAQVIDWLIKKTDDSDTVHQSSIWRQLLTLIKKIGRKN